MEFRRGERVNLNFDTGGVEKLEPDIDLEPQGYTFPTFVGDIQERGSSPSVPPVAPSPQASSNGFPVHRKRVPRVSKFKQQRQGQAEPVDIAARAQDAPKPRSAGFDADEERKAIDEENKRILAGMSEAEIEQERQDLMSSLSSDLLQKLLLRSNLNDGSNERDIHSEKSPAMTDVSEKKDVGSNLQPYKPTATADSTSSSVKKVSFAASRPDLEADGVTASFTTAPQPPSDTRILLTGSLDASSDSVHFPSPAQPPELDPDDPSFLKNLHDKYFPSLPYNPSQLSWMSPIDLSDKTSPYHPSQTALKATELRFDFKGALLAPSIARSMPSDMGLHHHAEAPEAAGYTIPELAVLARSKVPAQRCMAYQTLGRILYRLGQGEFGVEKTRQDTNGPVQVVVDPDTEEEKEEKDEDEEDEEDEEDVSSAMAAGLWSCIEGGRVVETMTEEANRTRGHLTARTFAQEALWNWRRGGGRLRHAI